MPAMSQEKLKKLVSKIVGLPTLPSILDKMNKMVVDPNTTAQQVGALISGDPAIASKVLRIVNSSFYGFPTRITTVSHAIVILGFNAVKSIVLSSSIFDAFGVAKKKSAFDRKLFWKHSIGCGVSCRVLARKLGFTSEEEFFIGGLLHDIGKVILDQYLHDLFEEILAITSSKNCLIAEAEVEVLGVTHAEIAGWLFGKWGLSGDLVQAVTYHHAPSREIERPKFCAIIHFGDILARALKIGSGGDNRIPAASREAWEIIGLEMSVIDEILPEIDAEMEKAMVFLDFIR